MISLIVALLAGSAPVQPQAVQATLQSCALENGRTVCRYTLPDIVIGSAPVSEVVGAGPDAPLPQPLSRTAAPAIPTASFIAASAPAPVVLAPAVSECADAGWTSSCPPDDRPPARSLRDDRDISLTARREVTRLLGDDQCEAAVKAAPAGGDLAPAPPTRDDCATATSDPIIASEHSPAPVMADFYKVDEQPLAVIED